MENAKATALGGRKHAKLCADQPRSQSVCGTSGKPGFYGHGVKCDGLVSRRPPPSIQLLRGPCRLESDGDTESFGAGYSANVGWGWGALGRPGRCERDFFMGQPARLWLMEGNDRKGSEEAAKNEAISRSISSSVQRIFFEKTFWSCGGMGLASSGEKI